MLSGPDWLSAAVEEMNLGVREIPGSGDSARIVAYHGSTSLGPSPDSVPWCASFACFCVEAAGLRSPRSARARDFLAWGASIFPPPLGAVTILRRSSGPGAAGADVVDAPGHVGFFLWQSPRDRTGYSEIFLLGGNQTDRVSVAIYPSDRVIGYRWPVARSVERSPVPPA